jgi:hypothetical protein
MTSVKFAVTALTVSTAHVHQDQRDAHVGSNLSEWILKFLFNLWNKFPVTRACLWMTCFRLRYEIRHFLMLTSHMLRPYDLKSDSCLCSFNMGEGVPNWRCIVPRKKRSHNYFQETVPWMLEIMATSWPLVLISIASSKSRTPLLSVCVAL